MILWKNIYVYHSIRKTYHSSSFRNKALSYDFVEKHLYSIRKTYHSSSFRNKDDTKCSEYLTICEYVLRSRTFGMPNDKMQEYLDINLILETSFTLRNGILWKSLIQLIYINISKLIYQQLIFQQLIFQQLFYPTTNLSTANLSTANLSTANLITANLSTANFATAFKQINLYR